MNYLNHSGSLDCIPSILCNCRFFMAALLGVKTMLCLVTAVKKLESLGSKKIIFHFK
jgi:hypothetical protein